MKANFFLTLACVWLCFNLHAQSCTFTNPIKEGAADPHITYRDGFYYLLFTTGDGVWIRKHQNMHELGSAPGVKVWSWQYEIKGHVWAPELHYLNGKWYLYACGSLDANNLSMRMFVLEANSADAQGSYTYRGLMLPNTGAIDESVWQDPASGRIYISWSQWDPEQSIFIAEMVSPTQIGDVRVKLSEPTNSWEKIGWPVNEGPFFLKKGNKLHLVFSVNGCATADYSLALLTCENGNYLDKNSWRKSSGYIFNRKDDIQVYGTGHHSTVQTPNGEWWLVYHAVSNSAGACDGSRSTRIQPFSFDANDYPVFGTPVKTGVALACPGTSMANASSNYWNFDSDMEGWNGYNQLSASVSGGIANLTITGGDPYFHSPDNLNVETSDFKYVVIRMQNQTGDNTAELFWTTTSATGFDGTKRVAFSVVPNDAGQRYYLVDLSTNPNWSGRIKQLRIDPAGSANSGNVKIDLVKFAGTYNAAIESIPGILELENFNKGGQNNAYYDVESTNYGGQYRTEGVDIQATSDAGGGYNVGWLNTGEWLEYLVNVSKTATYDMSVRVASTGTNSLHIEFNGENKSGALVVNTTGGVQSWSNLVSSVSLNEGKYVMRVFIDNSTGGFNLNKIQFTEKAAPPVQNSTPPTVAFGNDWMATDGLGRPLPSYSQTGGIRKDRYVGMFYWLWHSYIRLKDGKQKVVPELLRENPNSPAFECNDYYWGEPENGFYHPRDPWTTRRNLQMMANAGIDFIYLDFTNGSQGCDALPDFMAVALDMHNKGVPVPKLVFFLNEGYNDAINCLMDNFYNQAAYQPLWFYWQGKPLIMADPSKACAQSSRACQSSVQNFFTWKKTWAFDPGQWNFLDTYPQDYFSLNGVAEQMPVQKSLGAPLFSHDQGSSFHAGTMPQYDAYWETPLSSQGLAFEEHWGRAHQIDPQIVCITGWNELCAAAWPTQSVPFMGKAANDPSWRCVNQASCLSKDGNGNHIPHGWHFVDEFNTEFNRDIEPMKGGYTDSYYYQMVNHVRRHKGLAAPQTSSPAKTISVDGVFSEWLSVTPIHKDAQGDTQHRNFQDVKGSQVYTNTTGRNDVIESRTTADGRNVYFYIKTNAPITSYTGANWMMVYLNTDRVKSTGWEGFDYVVNMGVTSSTETSVKRRVGASWVSAGVADYRVVGNEMEISVPRSLLGMTSDQVNFLYQIFDNPSVLDNMEDNFVHGESAPDRRFNFSNSVSSTYTQTQSLTCWHFAADMEQWGSYHAMTASASSSIATVAISGADPFMVSPQVLVSASKFKYVVIGMQNLTSDAEAQLFYTTSADGIFSEVKSKKFAVVPSDTRQRYYLLDFSSDLLWAGNITSLRLDPVSNASSGSVKIDFIKFVGTYPGSFHSLPGIVEAENYNEGGQGNAYSDADATNIPASFRTSESVDVEACGEGGFNTGWISAGEWMEYLVHVRSEGMYSLGLRTAAVAVSSARIELDGMKLGNSFSIPVTGGWQTYTDVIQSVALPGGLHILRIYMETSGFNLNAFNVTSTTAGNINPTVSITSPSSGASYTAPSTITITANANDADGSISIVEFYNGTSLIGSDATAPYSFAWNGVSVGNYVISARAADNRGGVSSSTAIQVAVKAPTNSCSSVPLGSADWALRNSWSDQSNGSVLSSDNGVLKVSHRQWGQDYLWLISTSKYNLIAGVNYTFSYEIQGSVTIATTELGIANSYQWDGPVLAQNLILAPNGYTTNVYSTKSLTIKPAVTGSYHLAIKVSLNGQPPSVASFYLRNLQYCTASTARAHGGEDIQVSGMIVYPNPSTSEVSIVCPGQSFISVYNSIGQLVLAEQFSDYTTLNISSWGSGIYQVKLKSESGERQKILIKE